MTRRSFFFQVKKYFGEFCDFVLFFFIEWKIFCEKHLTAVYYFIFTYFLLLDVKETGAGAKKVEDDGTLREFPIGRPKSCKTSCDAADDVSGWNSMSAEEEATICQYCGVMFSYRQALEKHSVNCGASTTEEGDARFQCDDCGHKFKSKSALARHRQVHDVQRPFLCHCGQSYKRYKHLQNHLLLEHNTVVRQENPLLVTVCADSSDIALSDDMVVEAVLS